MGRKPLFCLLILGFLARAHAVGLPPMLRAGGSVYLRVPAGETAIVFRKRDLNIYAGPDVLAITVHDVLGRQVRRVEIPDDGLEGKGPRAETVQEARLAVSSLQPGVIRLQVQTNGDLVWGLQSTAEKLVADAKMMLNAPEFGASIHFRPPATGSFQVEAQAIHAPGFQDLPLMDAKGAVVHVFPLREANTYVPYEVGAGEGDRSGLWQLPVAKADVMIQFKTPPRWTLDPDWWFELPDTSWNLLPRHEVRYLREGETATVRLRLYSPKGSSVAPVFRFVPPEEGRQPQSRVRQIAPGPMPGTAAAYVVDVDLALPTGARNGESYSTWLCAMDAEGGVLGSMHLEARAGPSPVGRALKLPIRLGLHAHENVLYGYAPDYVPNEVYFTPDNRALIRNRWADRDWTSAVMIREDGAWLERPFTEALDRAYPAGYTINRGAGFMNCKVVADKHGGLYTALCTRHPDKISRTSLLYSFDEGRSWKVVAVPGVAYDIENFSGHNQLDGPPPFLVYRYRAKHPTAEWGAYHDLLLYLPERRGDELVLGDPIPIVDDCLGSCQHSGGPPSLATRDGHTHVIWAQAIETEAPGVPTYIATVDHATRAVSPHVFLGYAPPINDVHNVPAVCLDSQGTVHIVTGAHGANFTYRHSLRPNDTQSGFSEATHTLDAGYVDEKSDANGRGRQTYCSLVCDDQDTLHIAFRQWRKGVDDIHRGSHYAALSIQSKPKDKPWGPARPVVAAPLSGYSIYYHKLTVAPDGGLWLSYSYLSGTKSYQDQFPEMYNNRAVLFSDDHGITWRLARSSDFPDGTK